MYLGHGIFHPVEGFVFSKSVFGGGLKLPTRGNLSKIVVHLFSIVARVHPATCDANIYSVAHIFHLVAPHEVSAPLVPPVSTCG